MCKDMLFLSNRVGFEENGIQALISATDLELYHMLLEMGFWVRVQEKTWWFNSWPGFGMVRSETVTFYIRDWLSDLRLLRA